MLFRDRIWKYLQKKSCKERQKVMKLELQKAELEREIAIAKKRNNLSN